MGSAPPRIVWHKEKYSPTRHDLTVLGVLGEARSEQDLESKCSGATVVGV